MEYLSSVSILSIKYQVSMHLLGRSEEPVDCGQDAHRPVACVVQVPPLAHGVSPAVACGLVGAGLVEHDAQVGQVEHGQQPEYQID